ncbi:MAG: ligase-associated DNA damage response endonuclease PdeM [Phycisphaeraceae bacterium]|nr:ligase-associated DNA damage response endonuclease PdeM [Phycisphaeraceae bacterium]
MKSLEIQVAEKPVLLLPDRAAFLPECGTLLVADLHLGRQHSWREEGMPIGAAAATASLDEPLKRLAGAVRETGAKRIRVLGDLLHAPTGMTAEMIARVALWRKSVRIPIELIPGNHDRRLHMVLHEWDLHLHEAVLIEPPFAFTHEPASAASGDCEGMVVWCGHVHPLVHLRTRGDSLRLPCFCFGSTMALLPAFSGMSSGATIRPQAGERVYAITDDAVVDVSEGASTPRVRFPRSGARSGSRG